MWICLCSKIYWDEDEACKYCRMKNPVTPPKVSAVVKPPPLVPTTSAPVEEIPEERNERSLYEIVDSAFSWMFESVLRGIFISTVGILVFMTVLFSVLPKQPETWDRLSTEIYALEERIDENNLVAARYLDKNDLDMARATLRRSEEMVKRLNELRDKRNSLNP